MLRKKKKKINSGRGFVNSIINSLPFELHVPGYQFCGPGTDLKTRLARGDQGINKLDSACKNHDIAYSKYKDLNNRHKADLELADKAWSRVKSTDAGFGERAAAWAVTNAMKAKVKLGMGYVDRSQKKKKKQVKKQRKIPFRAAVKSARDALKKTKATNINDAIKVAITAAKKVIKRKNVRTPRIIPIPKVGGALPFLLPLFAGLSAIGSLAGGTAGVAKAITDASNAKKQLAEKQRHNKTMKEIALKNGNGLFLRPYKTGLGLYMNPKN
ncbi:uncharacterized protein LOC123298951 [Chrysoperla carnea]|uniref:uncharacterized protein LOC123298951 n=1 Tax=Chrysoperla carnea TaxID=189513 RepID=UPI001D05CBA0|nr:uncharacterized protein LOC123298951 [Chrysoperla carnea]